MSTDTDALRAEVALAGRVLDGEGLSDYVWGHISARDPAGRGVWMKAAGLGFDEVDDEDVQLVSWTGVVLEGRGPRHAEFPIHTEVMRARPDVESVAHCHPAHVIALLAAGRPLHAFSHTGGIFARPLPRYAGGVGLIDTPEGGAAMAAALGDARAVLLEGHGVVTVGAQIGVAAMTAVMLERACRLQVLADAVGGVRDPCQPEVAVQLYAHVQADAHMLGAWRHLARRQATKEVVGR